MLTNHNDALVELLIDRCGILLRYTRRVHSLSRVFIRKKVIFACNQLENLNFQDCKKATGFIYLYIIISNYKPRTTSGLFFLTIFVNLRPLTQF